MWPALKQPWYFQGPNDIAVDSDGTVYISDTSSHRIQKLTSDGTFITTWGSEGAGNGEFNQPAGIAVDSEGNVYVADSGNNRIQKFTSEGISITPPWGSEGNEDGEFRWPGGIAVDSSGNVYVTDSGNNRIQKFTSDGTFITTWGSEGSGDGEFDGPGGISTDSAGNVYVADSLNERIQKFTSEGIFITTWGSEGSGNGEFDHPEGIAVSPDGNVYVIDKWNNRIQKFTPDGFFLAEWGSRGDGNGELYSPTGIALGPAGNVYVADKSNRRIQKFTPDGFFLAKWGSRGNSNGEFDQPSKIAVGPEGNIYVADSGNDRIQKFTSNGTFITKWGSEGNGDGELKFPGGIAVDSSGNVYVADTNNNRIQKFTSDGTFITTWGSEGSGDGEFDEPYGMAVGPEENIYVADYGNDRVQKFTSDGIFITKWGRKGNGNWEFYGPGGIAVDLESNVYVTDFANNRIQKFDSDGTFITTWGNPGSGNSEFAYTMGITVDFSGNVYVADRDNHRIQKFTSEGTFITKWGVTRGSSPGQMNGPEDVAVSTVTGKIYVTDTSNHRIQVFKKIETLSNSRAIIVAGRESSGDSLWNATQTSANSAYRTLLYQGFAGDDIYYLSADTDLDLDNNGVLDDVDGKATKANIEYAVTQWAVKEGTESLVLYCTDHGGEDKFRLNETEILSSTTLSSWLDELQESISGRIIVIYDACESGSFIDNLRGDDRIIITSTLPDEKAKFLNHGTISFSGFFWTHIFNGLNIEDAFKEASKNINFAFENQNPMLSGEAENVYIGNGVGNMVGDAPDIGSVSPPQEIYFFNSADLYADALTDPEGDTIARVWAVIWPPDYIPGPSDDPLLSLPMIDLESAGGGRYSGTYTDFSTDGTYQIAIYAMDSNNNSSIPKITTVSRNYHTSRKAIIVAGDESESITRQVIETNAGLAYNALKAQLYDDSDIYFMSVTGIEGFDVSPSLFYLELYVGSLLFDLTTANLDLTVYLIGDGDEGTFKLNDTETLTVSVLDGWLDNLQSFKPGRVIFIYEGDKSGSFIPPLVPPAGKERLLIAGTGKDGTSYFNEEGTISFSSFFWDQISGGATVYDGFVHAKKAISYLSRKGEISFSCYKGQDPLLEADGNSVGNEETDYEIARDITIGIGMKFADDPPQIGSVSVDETEGVVTIAAENITATGTIQRIWAVIKPIGYCPGEAAEKAGDLSEVELTDPDGDGRYEGTYSDPLDVYKIQVYAMDTDSNTSLPKETKIYQEEGQDNYEIDDTRSQANAIVINHSIPQPHNLHAANDEDWIKFYGLAEKDFTYRVEADNLGADCMPVIELYYNEETVPAAIEDTILNNSVSLELELPQEGLYYVKLFNRTDGEETGYDLKVENKDAGGLLVLITGRVEDQISREGIDGAFITTDGGGSFISLGGKYDLYQKPGSWTLEVSADGYGSYYEGISIDAGDQIISKDIMLDPTGSSTTTTTVDQNVTTTTVTICPQEALYGEYSAETEILRYFRDNVLAHTPEGREIIRLYYEWSPAIVKAMEEDKEFKQKAKKMVDGFLLLMRGEVG